MGFPSFLVPQLRCWQVLALPMQIFSLRRLRAKGGAWAELITNAVHKGGLLGIHGIHGSTVVRVVLHQPSGFTTMPWHQNHQEWLGMVIYTNYLWWLGDGLWLLYYVILTLYGLVSLVGVRMNKSGLWMGESWDDHRKIMEKNGNLEDRPAVPRKCQVFVGLDTINNRRVGSSRNHHGTWERSLHFFVFFLGGVPMAFDGDFYRIYINVYIYI